MANEGPSHEDDEAKFHLVDSPGIGGLWRELVRLFRLPVVARKGQHLYRVRLLGSDFELPFADGKPALGFVTTRFVSARTRLEAEAEARRLVLEEWQGFGGPGSRAVGNVNPQLSVENSVALENRILRSKGSGFIFFTSWD